MICCWFSMCKEWRATCETVGVCACSTTFRCQHPAMNDTVPPPAAGPIDLAREADFALGTMTVRPSAREVETALDPRPLLQTVKRIEQDLGRQPRLRWGPREIDIDILRYDERKVDEPGLHIPHAELQNRPFLLDLLTEISA